MQSSSVPRVSVVIPAYNSAPFIAETLESVLTQTYTDYEIIVVNDGSPDTPELEAVLAPYASRITYIAQENRGPGGARNTGVRRARGEFVAFLDSDDTWAAEFLSSQLAMFEADPGLDLVYADALLVGDSPLAGRTLMEVAPSQGEPTFERLAAEECTVFTSTVVARKRALLDAGLFDEQFFHSEDWDLWLRLAHRGGRIAYQRRVLACHRAHPQSLTAQSGALLRGPIRVADKAISALSLMPHQRALLEKRAQWYAAHLALMDSKRHLVDGRFREAQRLLREANITLKSKKLRTAAFLLRLTPSLLRRLYLLRNRWWLGSPLTRAR
ncbi:MAG: glycosyltransferase family 2 protein [Gemmatimonadetes bacterium]|nr:glycosyltransferase family 2 protein [Gemmatimonadota bacterium]